MTLEILQAEMIAAMKNKNKARKDTISSLIAAIKKTAIDERCKDNITEELVNRVILKEQKTVQEMISTCPESRHDLMTEYKERLSVVEEFAPKLISDEHEIKNMVTKILSMNMIELLKSNKSTVMKVVMPELKGKVDMKIANKIIAELLK